MVNWEEFLRDTVIAVLNFIQIVYLAKINAEQTLARRREDY